MSITPDLDRKPSLETIQDYQAFGAEDRLLEQYPSLKASDIPPLRTRTPRQPYGWQQLERQQQLQQAPDLTTYHESELPPTEEDLELDQQEEQEQQRRQPRQNAVVEGDDAGEPEQEQEEEPDPDFIEDTISIPIRNSFGDDQAQEVSIRGNKEAVERIKQERMLHADYTRKTTEVARQRDGIVEAVRQAQDASRTQYVQHLEALKDTVLQTVEPELRNVDWQKLAEEDPPAFLRLQARSQQLRSHMEHIQGEQRRIAETQATEDHQRLQQRIRESQDILAQTVPGWGDPLYGDAMRTVAQKYGFTHDEVSSVIDPRIIRMMVDNTKYHQGSDKRAIAKKRIASAPKPIPTIPGGPAPQPSRGTDSRLAMRFKRTGSIEDGARLLQDRLNRTR